MEGSEGHEGRRFRDNNPGALLRFAIAADLRRQKPRSGCVSFQEVKREKSGIGLCQFWVPVLAGFEQGIQDDEELAHASDLHDHVRFAGGFEAFCEGNEHGVEASRGEGCHIQSGAYFQSPSGDAAASFEFSTVMVVRGKSGQGRGLGAVGFTEFRHLGKELVGSRVADARHTTKDVCLCLPVVVGREEFVNRQFDLGKLFVEEFEGLSDGFTGQLAMRGVLAILLHRADLDDLSASGNKIL